MMHEKICIVGAGALGCLFAGLLCRAGYSVILTVRNEKQAAELKRNGLRIQCGTETREEKCQAVTSEVLKTRRPAIIIVCVKSYDTEGAARMLLNCIEPGTVVMTLQNGLDNAAVLQRLLPEATVIAGVTSHGSTLLGTGHVRHAGTGETIVGALDAKGERQAERVADLLNAAGIDASVSENTEGMLWGKVIINCGINPLAAFMEVPNGRIADNRFLRDIMRRAVSEASDVALACGIRLPYDDPVKKVLDVSTATSANVCSMLQDIRAGRRTEIDALNGAVVRHGQEEGLFVKVNDMLCRLIKAKQACGTVSFGLVE